MSANLSSIFGAGGQLFTNSGVVLSGGKIHTYLAGSTTPTTTWTSSTQSVANSNPIILDSSGRLANEVWLQSGVKYKFTLTDANDTPLGYTWDYVSGVNDFTFSQSDAYLLTHNMTSNADYTLSVVTTPEEWEYSTIKITDTGVVLTGAKNIIVPLNKKSYIFINTTAQALTLKTSTGTGIAVAAGKTAILLCDGTNVARVTADV